MIGFWRFLPLFLFVVFVVAAVWFFRESSGRMERRKRLQAAKDALLIEAERANQEAALKALESTRARIERDQEGYYVDRARVLEETPESVSRNPLDLP